LHNLTQKVLDLVQEKTGRPVVVSPDPALTTLAISRMAQGKAPAHAVSYNPSVGAAVDYLICYQCGFILRVFDVPDPERYHLRSSPKGDLDAERLVMAHLKELRLHLDKNARLGFQNQLLNGLMLQLRSVPIGLRVDEWLRHDYPDLIEQQRAMAVRQLNENAAALHPDVRRMAPAKFYEASVAFNAAFAAYWSRMWNDPLPLVPYRTTGRLAEGEQLLKLWDEIPAAPSGDRRLIEAWGGKLGLRDWFEFVPFV
jgi:hypothetical protein